MESTFPKTRLSFGPFLALILLFLLSVPAAWAVPGGWTVSWSDEFNQVDNSSPNGATWGYDTGCSGWGNAEWENYTNSNQNSYVASDAACTDGKCLIVKAINTGGGSCGYTSARLLTSGKKTFQYGWIEARMKLPYGQGIWPALWMLGTNIGSVGWPTCGEIDIMENIGNAADQGNSHGTIHGPGYSGGAGISSTYTLPGGAKFKDGYHTFAVNWQVNQLDFYVDDILYATRTPASIPAGTTWVYNQPFFLLLNLAVGGGWPGYPDGTTVFPQEYRVDYIRVYQQGTPVPTATPTNTPTPIVASTWRVNAGGSNYTDGAGNLWVADTQYSGGTAAVPVASAINGTTDDTLYQSERYGNPFTYTFHVPAGSYQVTLKFAETYSGITAAGQRVFNVSINGTQVLSNFDIFAEVGSNTADDKVFNNVAPSGGMITIQLGPSSVDNAKVDAIQIVPMPATPTFTSTRTSTPTSTFTRTSTWTMTATPTSTPSLTNTPTFTASRTSTPTSTASSTASATPSSTPTKSNTPSWTASSTSTRTPTWTLTTLPSSTPSSTATATFSSTSTGTSTFSMTPVLSATGTATGTSTPSGTATPSPTSTQSMTFTGTATGTYTFSPTGTPTTIHSFTPTSSSTPTSSLTPTSTHTWTLTGTFTYTPTPTVTPTLTATSSWTPTSTFTFTRTPTPSSTPTFTPTWTASATRTWTSTATASWTSTPTPIPAPVLYPNPWDGDSPLSLGIALPPGSEVHLRLWTSAFRMVWSDQVTVSGTGNEHMTLFLPKVANGLYYLGVESKGKHWVLKLLVLR
ncbi:MAG TPA: malectin domain-containing carbohydrate-binding protein [bacterium]|nr:malectin domain-containing carbohydrate-binding protein [bacterium]